jgi:DNA-binding NtrC family response regulator
MKRRGKSRSLVLVLEADSSLRKRAVDMLEQGGFEVLEAENAAATLLYLEARGDEVAAVFTELNLFGLAGESSLIQSMRQRWPHVRHFRREVASRDDPVMSEGGKG